MTTPNYCLGTVMQTQWGRGIIGLHRGRTQGTYEDHRRDTLARDVVHLRRMLAVRGRLAGSARRANLSGNMLDGLGEAVIAVTPTGKVLYANAAGDEMLRAKDGLGVRAGILVACTDRAERALKHALARACNAVSPEASAVAVPRTGGGRYDLSLVGCRSPGAARHVMILTRDPRSRDPALETRLRDLHGLTASEACLAVMLANGDNLATIGDRRSVTLGTIRTQIKAIMAKLDCHRQADIVALVKNLPLLR